MSKQRISDEDRAEQDWTDWFQQTKQNNLKGFLIFVSMLNDFVEANPGTASYLTVEDLHTILQDEI